MTICLGKNCSFGLPRVPFVNCRQLMYLVISLLVLSTGCGIWLCQFLIIAYLFTFQWESLESIRSKIQLTLFYKVVNDLKDIPATKYWSHRRQEPDLLTQRNIDSSPHLPIHLNLVLFFFSRTVPLWNSLPGNVAKAPSLVSFKEGLSTLLW